MPKRLVSRSLTFLGEHVREFLALILFAFVVLAVFAFLGWRKAADAQNDLASLQQERRDEKLAQDTANRTAEVALCFGAARNRPRLVLVLRALNGVTEDMATRVAIRGLITDYEGQPVQGITGEPTRDKCVARARELDVDYGPYDFDPETGDLLNPPNGR